MQAIRFLTTFTQALATMALYRPGHPARERAIDAAYDALQQLQSGISRQQFTFLGNEVLHGVEPIAELKAWDWSARLASLGLQRLEIDEQIEREELDAFLEEVFVRMSRSGADSPEARQLRRTRIRFGMLGVRGGEQEPEALTSGGVSLSLDAEADAVQWLHDEVERRSRVPIAEAETVVRSLSLAMHGDQHVVVPLLTLREYDEYTTTHSLNVSVLSMALAEYLGLSGAEVRAFGIAGLLHDIGKVRIPEEILNKPGRLTDEERAIINRHPSDGARMLLESGDNLDLAATVAYEHHLMHDGGGYPALYYCRTCHASSRIAHVCDVYDALRTNRPYREAWSNERVLAYITERAGTEFDPEIAHAFVAMMNAWELRMATVEAFTPGAPAEHVPAAYEGLPLLGATAA
jgi:putative nucleotidyltransferase with HDIG domain